MENNNENNPSPNEEIAIQSPTQHVNDAATDEDLDSDEIITEKPEKPNPKHEVFVMESARCLNYTKGYMIAYPGSSYQSANANASRLLKKRPYLKIEIIEGRKLMLEKKKKMSAVLAKQRMESLLGMRDLLAAIVSGDMKFDKTYKADKTMETMQVKADAREVLQAVGLNLRLLQQIPGVEIMDDFEILFRDENGELEEFD
jgi:phage terminase small subunit